MNVQFTIDPLLDAKPISRYIYGVNQVLPGYTNYTAGRLGGDLTTAWDWENGESNAGRDYYFQNESLAGFTGGTGAPGGAAAPVLQTDHSLGAGTLLTVPINGYVGINQADDSVLNNAVTTVTGAVGATATVIPVASAAAIPSTPYYIVIDGEEMEVTGVNLANNQLTVTRGIAFGPATLKAGDSVYLSPDVRNAGANYLQTQFKQELPMKPGAPGSFTLTPDPNGQYVYEDEFVNWVNTMYPYGETSSTSPIWFQLDNEPDLWNSTHTEIQPNPVTYSELIQDSVAYAKAIKSVEPNALVFGPTSYGWEGYLSLQNAPDAAGRDWLDYYLQQMQQASAAAGQRLLDVLDVHFYTSTPNDAADIVQAPRSLWDPTYMENSWIAQSVPGAIELLPRLQADVNQYDPGTKLSISEYNYGGGDQIAGAIAQADALGIFGEQGLYAAMEWQLATNESYIAAGFNMFRDFDGKDSTFGDTSVMATTSDTTDSSIYASIDSSHTNIMTLVAINKSTQAQTATIHLDHVQPGAMAAIYQLTGGSSTPKFVGNVTITNPADFTYTMPGSSVTTIRIVSPASPAGAPTVATPAQASPSTVTGVSTSLSVLGADTGGAANLTYTWSAAKGPAPVTFSANGTNAAQHTLATFSAPGTYSLVATITDSDGYFATSDVTVTVDATLAKISVTPSDPTTTANGHEQFTATALDQFGNPLAGSPHYSWSATVGSISASGVFAAPATAGNVTIIASAAGVQGSTSTSVVIPSAVITVSAGTDAALRAAVDTANTDSASGEAVTILFAGNLAGTMLAIGPVPLELKAGAGAIRIEGGGLITLSGGGANSVLTIDSGAHVVLDGVEIENGQAGSGNGGAITNSGTLAISNSKLDGNTASGNGGAIDNAGILTVTNVTFMGNSASMAGGAIDSEPGSTLSVDGATFSGNSAPTGGALNNAGTATIAETSFSHNTGSGGSGTGGAIANVGTLTLSNSTIVGNSASSAAGGISNSGAMTVIASTIEENTGSYIAGGINNLGTMTVANTTLAGNYAYLGGAIYNGNYYGPSGNLTLTNDTITNNFADYGAGGGIYMANGSYSSTGPSTLALVNTIVAGNFASGNDGDPLSNPNAPFGPDINVYSGTVTGSYNLIGDGQGLTGLSNGLNHNVVGTPDVPIDPMLAPLVMIPNLTAPLTAPIAAFNEAQSPLADNGGRTQTIALASGSPAIGAGGAVTTIAGTVGSGVTAIPVVDAAAIASTPGEYFIMVDGEEMKVTSVDVARNILTVSRGVNGVTAAIHVGDGVYLANDQRGSTRTSAPDLGAYQTTAAISTMPTITSISPASGSTSGGTQVTISGTDLAGTTEVDFGKKAATIVSVSATTIKVVSPAGSAGSVDVTAITSDGTTALTAADRFTYEALPAITGISPATGLAGGGTGVTITGTNLLGATAVNFGAISGTIYSDTATQIEVISPAGAVGKVDVTVITGAGTSASVPADQFTYVAANSPLIVTTSSDALFHSGLSLRDAIAQANLDASSGVSDTIQFSSTLNGKTITLAQGATGHLVLSAQGAAIITINGGNQITISGGNTSGILQVNSGAHLVLTGLTLTGGNVGTNANGGAVNNAGTVMLLNDTLSNNSGGNGGAVFNNGTLTVMNSSFSKNNANTGGAIANFSGGRVTVAGSTFATNNGGYIGGAINNESAMTVANSTFDADTAYLGGAINNGNQYGTGGALTLTNDTLTASSVTGDGGGIYMENGGYAPKPSTLTLLNTIIAGNTADQPGPDVYVKSGTLAGAYNLIGVGTGLTSAISNNANGNQVGTSAAPRTPGLAALANNGGPTETMALLANSPAIAGGSKITTLGAAVATASATTITVASSAAIATTNPVPGNGYVLVIDGEAMLVTAVSGNTLTVQRGYHGTKAAPHANGASVFFGADQRGLIAPTSIPDLGAFQTTTHLVVTGNPANHTADAGQTVAFAASARGANLNVQWQVSTNGGKAWTNIAGATSKTVALVNGLSTTMTTLSRSATLAMTGREFRAVFKNAAGSVNSGPAILTVNPALAVGNSTRTAGKLNVAGFSGTLTISGGTGPYTIKSAMSLPPGLTASLKGKVVSITGKPTKVGSFKGSLVIVDAAGASVTKLVTITISA
jgi:hypothetical protein